MKRALPALWLALAGCTIDPPRPSPHGDGGAGACLAVDEDGDGFSTPGCGGADCDDRDALAFPGATDEVGDGVDQSCDGIDGVDEDADGAASAASGGDDCDDGHADVGPASGETAGFVRDHLVAPDVPILPVIALDGEDRIHLLWSIGTGPGIRYASDTTGTWTIEVAWAQEAVFTALAAAPDGTLDAFATDRTVNEGGWVRSDIQHARHRPGEEGWTVEPLTRVDEDHQYNGLGLSAARAADGTLYVAYPYLQEPPLTAHTELRVDVLAPDGGRETQVVDVERADAYVTSIAVGPDGVVHVAWADYGAARQDEHTERETDAIILVASNAGGSWDVEETGGAGAPREKPSIGVAPDGTVWLAYEDIVHQGVWVARRTAEGWEEQEVDGGHFYVYGVHLVVDRAGVLHLAYSVSTEGFLLSEARYATNGSGAWRAGRVDDTTAAAEVVLAVDSRDRPVIGYTRPTRGEVLVARTDGIDGDCDGQDF